MWESREQGIMYISSILAGTGTRTRVIACIEMALRDSFWSFSGARSDSQSCPQVNPRLYEPSDGRGTVLCFPVPQVHWSNGTFDSWDASSVSWVESERWAIVSIGGMIVSRSRFATPPFRSVQACSSRLFTRAGTLPERLGTVLSFRPSL